jgi:FkbM family methyltransferase
MTEDDIVSYSQNREDIILSAFFGNIDKGFYVDVGAFYPDIDSVTKYFYDRNWSGINIEPNSELIKLLEAARPRDINLNIGVSEKKSTLSFREYIDGKGLSTFSESIKKQHKKKIADEPVSRYVDHEVPVERLDNIFSQHLPKTKTINFLKVDVEGYEYEVLCSNDWTKYRPEVLCVEANHVINDWHDLLQKANYKLVFNDGLNEYFIDAKKPNLWNNFKYVEMVLGRNILTSSQKKTKDNLALSRKTIDSLIQKNSTLKHRVAVLEHAMAINARFRNQIKGTAVAFDRVVETWLGNMNKKRYKIVKFDEPTDSTNSLELLEKAQEVDKLTYQRPAGQKVVIHKKVITHSYRIFKKLTMKTLRITKKIAKKAKGAIQ